MITIIDYGAGNLRSVLNAFARLGYETKLAKTPQEVLDAEIVVLPGVGAASHTMENLRNAGLDKAIRRYISEDRHFLGICIGMQILLTGTEEGGWHECLGIIPGKVKRFSTGLKVPHMGWNQVKQKKAHPIFKGIPDEADFYFVHSYYADPDDKSTIAAETTYGSPFCSAMVRGNLIATQFHPEKSGEIGLKIYDNFIKNATGK
jgi:imidazole glycerol-phosphate synthase subunit HisH